jgi:hypothetical protein
LIVLVAMCAPTTAYSGTVDFPELFKYSEQKNANLETALLSISHSFKDNSVPVTQELLAAVMATLDKEVGGSYLPAEEQGDYGMGPSSTYTVGGSRRSTPYDGGIDYKGRGYIQITGKGNYQTYCGSDCIGTSSPELDVCGCKNQWQCTATDASTCPQVKALQTDYAAKIFASYYVKNGLVSLANAENYNAVGKAINGGAVYASDFNAIANSYLMLFSNNPDKTNRLLTWLNSGASTPASIGRTLYWIAIKRNDINLAIKCEDGTCGKQDKYGHYWIEILDGPDGNPVESYGWWPMSKVSPMETLVGVQGELNGVTSFGGTPTSDPHQGDTADEEFHPRLTNTLTDQQVLDRIHEFVRSYKGEWRWTFGLGQNCRTFQTGLMNYVGLTK